MEIKVLDAYTDYPFEKLGDPLRDTTGKNTPIRKCMILSYDGNKYCDIIVYYLDEYGRLRSHIDNIKQFYLYKNEEYFDNGIQFTYAELETLPFRTI